MMKRSIELNRVVDRLISHWLIQDAIVGIEADKEDT